MSDADRPLHNRPLHPETLVVEGRPADTPAAPLITPIYTSTTFVFDSAADLEAYQQGRSSKFIYSRYANPTVVAVEQTLARLEGAEAALLSASGMAATSTALFGLLAAGDELICSGALYGGTLHLASEALARYGIGVRVVSLEALAALDAELGPRTRVVWFESPSNPALRCVDLQQVADACRRRGVVSIIDSTFAGPLNQQPLSLGVDLVMHSATKSLNGHSDVSAGVLAGSAALVARLRATRTLLGGVIDPASASALGRGLKTLAVRTARQNTTAHGLAEWLSGHPAVRRVWYPGLASHPDAAIARRQMSGFGGMIAADLSGGYAAASRFYDRLRIVQRAASLGGVESVCSLPVLTSHYGMTDAELAAGGVTRGMVRLSIGLEHPEDLRADLARALAG
jgi:cystathionine beta-lyase/cystathionine gamma-synthase